MKAKLPTVKIKFTTLSEYFGEVGTFDGFDEELFESIRWRDAYISFEHRFPYGLLAGRPQRADRVAEDAVLRTERICSIAEQNAGQGTQGVRKELINLTEDIWRLVLIGQHHDAWVCAPIIFGIWKHGYKSYAELTYASSEEALRLCEQVLETVGIVNKSVPTSELVLVNVCGFEREEIVPFEFELPKGIVSKPVLALKVGNKFAPLPAVCEVLSRHIDGSAKGIKGWVLTKIPSLGYRRISVVDASSNLKVLPMPKAKTVKFNNAVMLENRFVRIVVGRNGLIEAFTPDGKPLLRAPLGILSRFENGDQTAVVESVEISSDGPIPEAEAKYRIGKSQFEMKVRLSPVSPIVRLNLDFNFGKRTVVGVGEPVQKGHIPWLLSNTNSAFCLYCRERKEQVDWETEKRGKGETGKEKWKNGETKKRKSVGRSPSHQAFRLILSSIRCPIVSVRSKNNVLTTITHSDQTNHCLLSLRSCTIFRLPLLLLRFYVTNFISFMTICRW